MFGSWCRCFHCLMYWFWIGLLLVPQLKKMRDPFLQAIIETRATGKGCAVKITLRIFAVKELWQHMCQRTPQHNGQNLIITSQLPVCQAAFVPYFPQRVSGKQRPSHQPSRNFLHILECVWTKNGACWVAQTPPQSEPNPLAHRPGPLTAQELKISVLVATLYVHKLRTPPPQKLWKPWSFQRLNGSEQISVTCLSQQVYTLENERFERKNEGGMWLKTRVT